MKKVSISFFIFLLFFLPLQGFAEEDIKKEKKNEIPDFVLSISKENTYPNPTQDLPYLQPSELTQGLLDSANEKIENPELIRILNESTISLAKTAPLFRANIYLGEWPLSYKSNETNVNWEYKQINTNFLDNRGGKAPKQLSFNQEQQKKVTGGLTAELPHSDEVKKMMMIKAAENTGLPLAFETNIGYGTKKDRVYNVQPKNVGYLYAYVPAANEKGQVTYGEVYLTVKFGKIKLEVKNVTQQGIGAWVPVQDYLAFKFNSANHPR
ncbi:YfkD famly protein [Bacillus alkalicellulosilyticus]|uniref:YfkD famly protein n=1 Tax=Alkalihalobacterium alkalicellulosilyticum TaxID=1912214 RepID=UPI00099896ED|nr:YfkD famly protein [Bacillus alkalicellulosilyticus]